MGKEDVQNRLEWLTGKWWFILLFVIIQFIPPYASRGFDYSEIDMITRAVLSNAIIYRYQSIFPVFKIAPLLLFLLIALTGNRVNRIFSIYVGINYLMFAFLQSIAVTEEYGLAIITVNLLMFILVASLWLWEAVINKNDLTSKNKPFWRYWVIPLAILAFWYPCTISGSTAKLDFNPLKILTNEAGLTFCMMTPVYLAILTLYHPEVNVATMRVTALVGVIIGFYNVLMNFFIEPSLWWNGVLHIPLLTISIYSLILSFRKTIRG